MPTYPLPAHPHPRCISAPSLLLHARGDLSGTTRASSNSSSRHPPLPPPLSLRSPDRHNAVLDTTCRHLSVSTPSSWSIFAKLLVFVGSHPVDHLDSFLIVADHFHLLDLRLTIPPHQARWTAISLSSRVAGSLFCGRVRPVHARAAETSGASGTRTRRHTDNGTDGMDSDMVRATVSGSGGGV